MGTANGKGEYSYLMKYSPALLKAFLVFPLNVMGTIPALILWSTGKLEVLSFGLVPVIVGGFFVLNGLYTCWVTVSLFTDYGEGTPAPWAPPQKLVVRGIYQHARNPMLTGVMCVLVGEAILFTSFPVFLWFAVFCLGSLIIIPLQEEPTLDRRFGESYREYRKHVPRWIPRMTPWKGTDE